MGFFHLVETHSFTLKVKKTGPFTLASRQFSTCCSTPRLRTSRTLLLADYVKNTLKKCAKSVSELLGKRTFLLTLLTSMFVVVNNQPNHLVLLGSLWLFCNLYFKRSALASWHRRSSFWQLWDCVPDGPISTRKWKTQPSYNIKILTFFYVCFFLLTRQ